MKNISAKILILPAMVVLLAAGCSKAASQTSTSGSGTAQNQGGPGNASTTRSRFGFPNIPAGDKPFVGMVSSVNGSTLTISTMGFRRTSTSTPPTTSTSSSTIVDLLGTTTYNGGSQSSIASGTRVAGYGSVNSDGSINAVTVMVNPPRPTGGAGGRGGYGGGGSGQYNGANGGGNNTNPPTQ